MNVKFSRKHLRNKELFTVKYNERILEVEISFSDWNQEINIGEIERSIILII